MQLPARIGKYELIELLGGGMSQVYRARDTVMDRTVAIKILTDAACQDAASRERFLLEARKAGGLAHENIISIYDFGEDEQGRPYMVMEFLQGEDLKEAIRNGHTGDLKNRLKIALSVARALKCVHDHKLVHRDVKPENVHVNTKQVVKLMDFGIVKAEGFAMTQAGFVLGTPYYMAPEQVTGADVTFLADVYAFGVLLAELISGIRSLQGDTLERIFYRILHEPLDLEPLRTSGAPPAVLDLIGKCTAKNPAERPQGLAPVIDELERMIASFDSPTYVLPAPVPEPTVQVQSAGTHRRWVVPAAAAGGVILLVAIYLVVKPGTTEVDGPDKQLKKAALQQTISTPTGEMVLVPGGEFLFGEKKERISLPPFYVDRTEVTNRAYQDFCRATGRVLPDAYPANEPLLPVVNVTWDDARDFAAWAGKRLPKPAEWEKAARGADGRTFPWGEKADPTMANVNSHVLRPADGFPQGVSPFGAFDMVGNVWEYVDQVVTPSAEALRRFRTMKPPPSPDEPWHMMRGQSHGEPLLPTVMWDSASVPARWRDRYLGFRCVKDAGSQ